MTLNFEPKKRNTTSIGGEQVRKCVSRLLNDDHVIIHVGTTERYRPLQKCKKPGMVGLWEYFVSTFHKDEEVFEGSLVLW